MELLSVVLGSLGGGAGLASVLTVVFSYRKFRAEAEAARVQNEETEMEYIKKSFKELNEETKTQFREFKESSAAEIKGLHEEIDRLNATIKELNNKLLSLMSWVEGDNKRYREWLENKIHELDPSIGFIDTTDPPNIYANEQPPTSSASAE